MKTYSLSPEGIQQLEQRQKRVVIVVFAFLMLVIIGINIWTLPHFSLVVALISLAAGAMGAVIGLRITLARTKDLGHSLQIELSDDYIVRSQTRFPSIRIERSQVKSIQEGSFGLVVRNSDRLRSLIVPMQLGEQAYNEIKTQLAVWSPIHPVPIATRWRNLLILAALLAGIGILFFSWQVLLVVLAGSALTVTYGYLYFLTRNSEAIPPRYRRHFLWFTLFVIVVTTIKVLLILSGFRLDTFLERF